MKSLQIEKRVALFFFRPGEPLRKAPSPVGDDFLTERRQCRGRRRIPGSIRVARTAAILATAATSTTRVIVFNENKTTGLNTSR